MARQQRPGPLCLHRRHLAGADHQHGDARPASALRPAADRRLGDARRLLPGAHWRHLDQRLQRRYPPGVRKGRDEAAVRL